MVWAACGGGQPAPAAASEHDEPFTSRKWDQILPAGAEGVVVIDVPRIAGSKLLSSPRLAEAVRAGLSALSTMAQQCEVGTADIGHIVVAQYPQGRYVAILIGKMDEARAKRCLANTLETRGSSLVATELAGTRVFHSSNERDGVWMAVPTAGVVVIANQRAGLREVLGSTAERIAGTGSSLLSRAESLDQSRTMWAVFKVPRIGGGLNALRVLGLDRGLVELSEVSAVIDIAGGVDVRIGLSFPDPERAARAHEFLRTTLELWKPPEPYSAIVSAIQIAGNEREVTISLSLSQQNLEALLSNVTVGGQDRDGS